VQFAGTGLREAKGREWKVEVVGDSNLILCQLADYRPLVAFGLGLLFVIYRPVPRNGEVTSFITET
jgi:hypothetical protein